MKKNIKKPFRGTYNRSDKLEPTSLPHEVYKLSRALSPENTARNHMWSSWGSPGWPYFSLGVLEQNWLLFWFTEKKPISGCYGHFSSPFPPGDERIGYTTVQINS